MQDLDEFDAETPVFAEKVKDAEFVDDGEDDILKQDMYDAISLLTKTMHLLSYMGDDSILKVITKRERKVMADVADELKEFLDAVAASPSVTEE